MAANQAHPIDPRPVLELIASIEADLVRLKGMLEPPAAEFDPANPHNKTCDGKLTEQGVECCYRMFDEGKSRYSVSRAMKISFAAATHRFNAWRKAGGEKRVRSLMGRGSAAGGVGRARLSSRAGQPHKAPSPGLRWARPTSPRWGEEI